MKIVSAMASVVGEIFLFYIYRFSRYSFCFLGIPVEEVWEAYGGFLIQFTMETGWDQLLRAMAPDLEGFLNALDSLHYFIDQLVCFLLHF